MIKRLFCLLFLHTIQSVCAMDLYGLIRECKEIQKKMDATSQLLQLINKRNVSLCPSFIYEEVKALLDAGERM